MIRTYDEAMWDARLTSTLRLRRLERRARRMAQEGRLDSSGHVRWAAALTVLRDRDATRRPRPWTRAAGSATSGPGGASSTAGPN
jgi:acyl-CoA thioesterase FadM